MKNKEKLQKKHIKYIKISLKKKKKQNGIKNLSGKQKKKLDEYSRNYYLTQNK